MFLRESGAESLHVSPIVEDEKVYMFLRWKTIEITVFCGKPRAPRLEAAGAAYARPGVSNHEAERPARGKTSR